MTSRTTEARRSRSGAADAPPPENGARAALFRALAEEAQEELRLCDEVEALADHLPEMCASCCSRMGAQLVRRAREEEYAIGACMIAQLRADPYGETAVLKAALDQARLDRIDDQGVAFELSEALVQAAVAKGRAGAPALGYLMRNFFEGRRRRTAWESAALFEPAKLLLSDGACADLFASATAGGHGGLGGAGGDEANRRRANWAWRRPVWADAALGETPPPPLKDPRRIPLADLWSAPTPRCPRCDKRG
ncbi:MAG: hypothetical protein AAGM38_16295 [Pseudomonadota bacterium]